MKILFVLEHYAPYIGGVEVLFEHLCEGLARRYDVTVVTSRLKGTASREVLNGVAVHRVKVPGLGGRYWFTFCSIPCVYRLARKADLIHTTTYTAAPSAWLISRLTGRKCLITVHEALGRRWMGLTGMGRLAKTAHRLLERLIFCLPFDRFLCVSHATAGCLKKMVADPGRIEVIYNGVDYSLFHRDGRDGGDIRARLNLGGRFVYMYHGRPGISRGVEYLVQAVPRVAKEIPDSTLLLLLSHQPARRYRHIRKLIEKLNAGRRLVLLDPVPRKDLPRYLDAVDCVVIPSLSEGFGFSAAEACAMEKPVIASEVGSLPEVVSGRHIFVEPGDAAGIARALKKASCGEFDYAPRREFHWEECLRHHEEVYDRLLKIFSPVPGAVTSGT